MRVAMPLLAALLVVSLPSVAKAGGDDTEVMSLRDLEGMAIELNPALGEARSRVEAARGRWVQAGLGPNPTVGYLASEVGNEGHGGQQGAFVQKTFIRGGKLGLSQQVVCRDLQRLQASYQVTEQRVLSDVRLAFYSLLNLQQQIKVMSEFMASLNSGVDISRRLVEARETGKTDMLLAEVEQSRTAALLMTLKVQEQTQWRSLAQIVGVQVLQPTELSDENLPEVPTLSWEDVLGRLLNGSPVLSESSAAVQREQAAVRRARAEVIPDITGQFSVQYDAATNYTVAGVQVGWQWPIHNRNQGGIREAHANLNASHQRRSRLENQIAKNLATEFGRLQQSRTLATQFSSTILPKANEASGNSLVAYSEGELGMADVLNAQRAAREANLEYLDAELQMRLSFERIQGFLLTDSLGTEVSR